MLLLKRPQRADNGFHPICQPSRLVVIHGFLGQ
jgi:hypothetical protein